MFTIENDSNWKESLWIGLAIFVSTLILFILVFVWLVCAPLKSFTSISVMQKCLFKILVSIFCRFFEEVTIISLLFFFLNNKFCNVVHTTVFLFCWTDLLGKFPLYILMNIFILWYWFCWQLPNICKGAMVKNCTFQDCLPPAAARTILGAL